MYFSSSSLQHTAVLQIFGYVAGKPSRHMDVLGKDFYRYAVPSTARNRPGSNSLGSYRITVPGSLKREADGGMFPVNIPPIIHQHTQIYT
jgi:hypothetical protein